MHNRNISIILFFSENLCTIAKISTAKHGNLISLKDVPEKELEDAWGSY